MKQYSLQAALHIILIILLSTGGLLLLQHQLWFSTLVTVITLTATALHLYSLQMKQIRMMRRLTDSIRFNDMTLTFPVTVKNRTIKELSEEFSNVLKLFRNRLLEEEIKHQYYENLLNKVDTAVLVASISGEIEWMNQSATNLSIGKTQLPSNLITSPVNETHVVHIEKNGTMQEMAVSSTLFSTQGKERLLISLKDIHSVLERNEMEAWQKLIRVLTHEIMNSITPIISLSETLSEREVPRKTTEKEYRIMLQAMQTIHRRSKGLLSFVDNYRRLTRISSPMYTDVSVGELFADLRKLFPDREIHIKKPTPDRSLYIDRSQIEQVLINLLKNAKEACAKQPDARIEMVCKEDDQTNQLLLSVHDNGEGILPEVTDKIFIPFFTTKISGSGIGLSLCKQIMNQHRGTITVSSKPGAGSCFTLSLPLR